MKIKPQEAERAALERLLEKMSKQYDVALASMSPAVPGLVIARYLVKEELAALDA